MKHLLIILLFSLSINAQIVSVGFDLQNAIKGSNVNVPALDIKASIASITKNREIGLEGEYFKEINYAHFGMFVNKVIPINKFNFVIGVKGLMIFRDKFTVFAHSFNGEIRYFFTKKLAVGIQYDYTDRKDLEIAYNDRRYVGNGYFNLIYKWK